LQCWLSLSGKPKPKPSRFRFLSSAKSLVQSVRNRGKAPAPAIASNIPKPTLTGISSSRNSGHTAGVPSIGTRASSTRMSSTGDVSRMDLKKTFGGASVTFEDFLVFKIILDDFSTVRADC
jgi:hypothetical protein